MDEELIHMDEQRIPVLEMASTLDEDAMKIVETEVKICGVLPKVSW